MVVKKRNRLRNRLLKLNYMIIKEVSMDTAFPDRKNSKTETLKAEIMDLERQLALQEQGLEDQSYEDYKQEYMGYVGHTGLAGASPGLQGLQGPSSKSKEDEIAELEAQLAALRG